MDCSKRKLLHVNLSVKDLEKELDFYIETLNFKVIERYDNGNREFVFISDGNVTYELFEKEGIEATTFDHIAYESEDIEADYNHFKNMEPCPLTTEIGYADFLFDNGVYYFFIKGPGNERIEFCQKKIK